MQKKIPLKNRDLRHYVLFRDIRRLLGYALWILIFWGGASSYNANHQTYPPDRLITGWKMALWLAIAAVTGFFLFRIWKFFTQRSCCGIIQSSGLSRSYSHSSDPKASGTDYDFRLNTALKVRQKNGRYCRLRFEQKNGFYHYYKEGNEILRFHGLPYPINLDSDAPYGYVCSACGMWSEHLPSHCEKCGHSIIDPKDIQSN